MFRAGSVITIEARAKINLTLEILGKRPDGYHELRSIVMPVSLSDTLSLTSTYAQTAMTVTAGPGVDMSRIGAVDKNLAMRAARLLQARYRVNAGARIHIHKRIPIGGGLGGGSADAAGVITGLDRLWGLDRPRGELVDLGAELGSDVPALVHGGAVLMEGRGERVRGLFGEGPPAACGGFWLVVANPGIMCSTPEVFKKWRAGLTASPLLLHNMTSSIRTSDVAAAAAALHNGLQPAVYESYPGVAQAADRLREAGCLGVLLSGSGASVFGLARDEGHGQEISRRLGTGLWHVLAQTCPVV
ncbi:MAG: 4-(cytidine 5'-diphospho)-2-C-methyl-D-erythritol kinase [Verrucomicrobiota bacterium]|nr:4-(cytidine 5'-diphospho)-2-C-methyl-D-erythritol kinase [Verrucomicrobiota bacterium]